MKIQSGGQGDQQAAEEERKAQVDDMKNSILSQVLSQEARARCEYTVSSKSNYFRFNRKLIPWNVLKIRFM